jgi:hypothetical protein
MRKDLGARIQELGDGARPRSEATYNLKLKT